MRKGSTRRNKTKRVNFGSSFWVFLYLVIVPLLLILIYSCGGGYDIIPKPSVTPTPTPPITYEERSKTWTNGSDFRTGEMNNVVVTADEEGLKLGDSGYQTFDAKLCIAASNEDKVYLHDLNDPKKDSAIPVDLPKIDALRVNPSRTAIDEYGNCYVGGRDNGGIYMISPSGDILATVKLPGSMPNARAVSIDQRGYVWIGDYRNHVVYKYQPDLSSYEGPWPAATDKDINGVEIPNPGPYGSAIDSRGYLFIVGAANNDRYGFISRINTNDPSDIISARTTFYGVVIGIDGHVWVGSWPNTGIKKIDKDSLTDLKIVTDIDAKVTGVGMDNDGNIWAAGFDTGKAYKVDKDGNNLEEVDVTSSSCQPAGITGDHLGNVWMTNKACDSLSKIDPKGMILVDTYDTGDMPYTYSDMAGHGYYRNLMHKKGKWIVRYSGEAAASVWKLLNWKANIVGKTRVEVRYRVAATKDLLRFIPWSPSYSISPFDFGYLTGQWIELAVHLFGDGDRSPVLDQMTLEYKVPIRK